MYPLYWRACHAEGVTGGGENADAGSMPDKVFYTDTSPVKLVGVKKICNFNHLLPPHWNVPHSRSKIIHHEKKFQMVVSCSHTAAAGNKQGIRRPTATWPWGSYSLVRPLIATRLKGGGAGRFSQTAFATCLLPCRDIFEEYLWLPRSAPGIQPEQFINQKINL